MNIIMSGLDYSLAPVSLREKLTFPGSRAGQAAASIVANHQDILGCVILSTCNRTEIYLSCRTGVDLDPAAFLCQEAGQSYEEFSYAFVTRHGEGCASHLALVSAGLKSQIWGDDQIVTQANRAIALSREAKAADAILETVFRLAVSAAKEIKTTVRLTKTSASASRKAVEVLCEKSGGLEGKKALVIGNGEMGRLAANALLVAGCQVWVTLRTYRHGETLVPAGCKVLPYEDRYALLPEMDVVISATTSPHYTLGRESVAMLETLPPLMVDLAMPRDIDPEISELEGVEVFNIDQLGERISHDIPQAALDILETYMDRLRHWLDYRHKLADSDGQATPAPRFPLFIDLRGRKCVVVGGGTIANRRVGVLRAFGADVTVIAPTFKGDPEAVEWIPRAYETGDLEGALLAVTATDNRDINRRVGEDARALNIPVSVADRMEECTFFFPAVCMGDGLTAGVVSDGTGHKRTAEAAKAIRKTLEDLT